MDEQRIRIALREIQEAPDRRRTLRRHVIGECVTALMLLSMLATHVLHW
jgi:hypothetical protein